MKRPRKHWSWKRRTATVLGGAVLLLLVLVGVGYALTDVPQPSKVSLAQASTIYYADGQPIGTLGTNRTLVSIGEIGNPAQKAVLAAEDRGFYSEPGISPKGIARAIFTNVKGGGVEQGGSTITQQYAKNAFLTQQRTFSRKIKEAFISVKLSQTTSKSKILEDYLNTIYFGRGAYGIEAAAETYFPGRTAGTLTVPQAAVLASSIRSPSGYDPTKHPEAAKARWAYVLDGMVKKGWLTQAQRDAAVYPTVAKSSDPKTFPGPLSSVRDQVLADLDAHGFSEAQVESGGYQVQTTILKADEDQATAQVKALVPAATKRSEPVAALVSVKPGDGAVQAYYGNSVTGGFDYADGALPDGPGGVQPGSSMKPYVLAAALDDGDSLDTRYSGASPQSICGDTSVTNDSGEDYGRITLTKALALSVNTVYVRLACDVGPDKVKAAAYAAGIPDTQPLSDMGRTTQQIALGSGGYEVHPLDQATGYATFAAGGKAATPYFVFQVKDNRGNKLYTHKVTTRQAFTSQTAANVTYAMQQVVAYGTGTNARLAGGRPTAGKTGTTSGNKNAWFVGITPQLSTAVWIGRPDGKSLVGTLGIAGGVYGGQTPAKLFKAYTDGVLTGAAVEQFPAPTFTSGDAGPAPTYSPRPSYSRPPAAPSPSAPSSVPPSLPPVLPSPSATRSPDPAPSPSASPPPAAPSASP